MSPNKPANHHSAANTFLKIMCDVAQFNGMNKEEFSIKTGINLKTINDPDAIISREKIVSVYRMLVNYTQDDFIGVGTTKQPMGTIDLVVEIASAKATLREAIVSIHKVLRISQGPISINMTICQSLVTWHFVPHVSNPRHYAFVAVLQMTVMYYLLSLLVKTEIPLVSASFGQPKPINYSDYQFIFQGPMKFNQAEFSLSLDKSWLDKPIKCNYQDVKRYLDVPLSLTIYSVHTFGLVRKIKEILSQHQFELPTLNDVAKQLNVSPRTLQRKLETENTNYQEIKDQVRQRKALFYIEHTDKTVQQISEKCGFNEVTSFSRAFKRWTGKLPSNY